MWPFLISLNLVLGLLPSYKLCHCSPLFWGPEARRASGRVGGREPLCENCLQPHTCHLTECSRPFGAAWPPHLSLSTVPSALALPFEKTPLPSFSWSFCLRLRRNLPPATLLHRHLFPPSGPLDSGGVITSCARLSQLCLFPLY